MCVFCVGQEDARAAGSYGGGLTPATRLLEKKREMTEVETALAAQKEEFQMKMETLQQRRDELERKERTLKEQLLKFEKFLKVRVVYER